MGRSGVLRDVGVIPTNDESDSSVWWESQGCMICDSLFHERLRSGDGTGRRYAILWSGITRKGLHAIYARMGLLY